MMRCITYSTASFACGFFSLSASKKIIDCTGKEELKQLAGYRSVDDYVLSGMVVGLGTGSTAKYAVERIGQKIKCGDLKNIIAIPTSEQTRQQAQLLNIPLATLNDYSVVDVVIDGADEVDPDLQLIKGGGGALLREKMVEVVSKKFIVIVDESKLVKRLGVKFPLPIEIVPFCHLHTTRVIESIPSLTGSRAILRMGNVSNNKIDGDNIAITDNGNYIIDLHNDKGIDNAALASTELTKTVGVVEHGLFVGMADVVIVAGSKGIRTAVRPGTSSDYKSGSSNCEEPWW